MELKDTRLHRVFDKIVLRIKDKQTLSLRKLSSSRKEEIQFGRFVGNKKVTLSFLENELYKNLQTNARSSHCLLIEDTSQVGFSLNRCIQDLGKVDKGQIQGFYIHPVLAIDAVNYGCLGIASLEFISRPWTDSTITYKQGKALRNKIPYEEKEGYRWFRSIQKAVPQCLQIADKTVVADREADIFPLLTGLTGDLGIHYIIRSRFDRPLESGTSLLKEVTRWNEEMTYQIKVPATDKRIAHIAKMAIKFGEVSLKKSGGKCTQKQPKSHSTYIVEVKELPESVVNNEQPIHWVLLTSHCVQTPEMALQIVEWYKQRWNVEQVFRTLKNKGLKIESSQIDNYEKLKKITLLALIAAVKVIQLVRARDGKTEQPIAVAFNKAEQQCLVQLNKQLEGKTEKLRNPHRPETLAYAAWIIARLAGWSGYKSQRPAGPIDFLIGLQRFNERFQGFMLAMDG
jgi:hypothetical protein